MTDNTLYVRAYAKINLFLDVTGRRDDGYHLVDLVMQSVGLHDGLYFTLAEGSTDTLSIVDADGTGMFAGLESDERNLVLRAVRLLRERYSERFPADLCLDIRLEKRIPSQAGLAGGSADAAAALIAVNRLFSLELSGKEVEEAALTLGADVPFCLCCGTLRAEGIGELLSPLSPMPDCALLIAKPDGSASTRDIYTAIDNEDTGHPDYERMASALRSGDIASVSAALANIMEPITAARVPDITHIISDMQGSGALAARMSGSGSAVFGIFDDAAAAERCADTLRGSGYVRSVYVTAPISAEDALEKRFLPEGS